MAGDNTGLLVVEGGVSGQLEYLSRKVLQNGGEVHEGSGSHSLGVVSFAEHTVDTSDGELESSTD